MILAYIITTSALVARAIQLPRPDVNLQQAFVLLPSCYFTWGNYFIGYGVDATATTQGIPYTDAARVCQYYTDDRGSTGQIVANVADATSVFPMLQLCQPNSELVGWISSEGTTCNIMSDIMTLQPNQGTIIPVPCTNAYSAVFCLFPETAVTEYSTTIFTTIQGTGRVTFTSTVFAPSFTSTTLTLLSSTPTTTTDTFQNVATLTTSFTTVIPSIISETSKTTETTTIRSTLRITDTESVTTVFTYAKLSITVSVPTVTRSDLVTETISECFD